jgi:ribosomal protein L24
MTLIKVGSQVKLLVGSKEHRGSIFTVKSIKGSEVYLDGYNLKQRTQKITQENTSNYRTVHKPVHISNVSLIQESK